jgi:hypothetical protein
MRTGTLGRTYADGTVIFREGDEGDCMYVIQAGQVEVLHERDGKETRLTTLSVADIFGEIAIFQRQVRTATIRAWARCAFSLWTNKPFCGECMRTRRWPIASCSECRTASVI